MTTPKKAASDLLAKLAQLKKAEGEAAPPPAPPAEGAPPPAVQALASAHEKLGAMLQKVADGGTLPEGSDAELRAIAGAILATIGGDAGAPAPTAKRDPVTKAIALDDGTAAGLMIDAVSCAMWPAQNAIKEGDMAKATTILTAAKGKLDAVLSGLGGGGGEPMAQKRDVSLSPANLVGWALGEIAKAKEEDEEPAKKRLAHVAGVVAKVRKAWEDSKSAEIPSTLKITFESAYAPLGDGKMIDTTTKGDQTTTTWPAVEVPAIADHAAFSKALDMLAEGLGEVAKAAPAGAAPVAKSAGFVWPGNLNENDPAPAATSETGGRAFAWPENLNAVDDAGQLGATMATPRTSFRKRAGGEASPRPVVKALALGGDVFAIDLTRAPARVPLSLALALDVGTVARPVEKADPDAPVFFAGLQTDTLREFFTGPDFDGPAGALVLRRKDDGTWAAGFAKSLVPTVLTPAAVEAGWLPPLGSSGLPASLEKVVPAGYRYWQAPSAPEALALRAALVDSGFFGDSSLAKVNGEIRRVVTSLHLYEPPADDAPAEKRDATIGIVEALAKCAGDREIMQPDPTDTAALKAAAANPGALVFVSPPDLDTLAKAVDALTAEHPAAVLFVEFEAVPGAVDVLAKVAPPAFFADDTDGGKLVATTAALFPERFVDVSAEVVKEADEEAPLPAPPGPVGVGSFVKWSASVEGAAGVGRVVKVEGEAAEVVPWFRLDKEWGQGRTASTRKLAALSPIDPLAKSRYDGIDLTPPPEVSKVAARGLAVKAELGAGAPIPDATVEWARRLSGGSAVTPEKARKMRAWHARNEVVAKNIAGAPATPALAAFLLQGGGAGRVWAEKVAAALDEADKAPAKKSDEGDGKVAKVVEVGGVKISIDRPIGFVQKGTAPDGTTWERTYANDYGFIAGTAGGDGEDLDVFLGPELGSDRVFVVEQNKNDDEGRPTFDEFKFMIGFNDRASAEAAYFAHVPKRFYAGTTEINMGHVRALLGVDPVKTTKALVAVSKRSIRVTKASAAEAPKEERFVLGVVLEPEVVDKQNDIYSHDEIRNAAHRFMADYRQIGFMHDPQVGALGDQRVQILESYIAPTDLDFEGEKVKKGAWVLGVRVLDDALWSAIKSGDLTGFSIGGDAIRRPDAAE